MTMIANKPARRHARTCTSGYVAIWPGTFSLLMAIAAAVLLLAGCQSNSSRGGSSADPNVLSSAETAVLSAQPLSSYALETDDVLSIKFFYNPELNETVTIGRDGMISLQLIEDIQASGKTTEQLEGMISESYTGILRNPEVAVIVQRLAPRSFYIFGEVNDPGTYPHKLGMTVIKAVATADGFTYRARKDEVLLTRRNDPTSTPVLADHATPVMPGDIIEVRERYY